MHVYSSVVCLSPASCSGLLLISNQAFIFSLCSIYLNKKDFSLSLLPSINTLQLQTTQKKFVFEYKRRFILKHRDTQAII